MADTTWLASTTAKASATLDGDEILRVIDDPAGTPASKKTTVGGIETYVVRPAGVTGLTDAGTLDGDEVLDLIDTPSGTPTRKKTLLSAILTYIRGAAGTTVVGRLARFTSTAGAYGQTSGLYEDGSGNVAIGGTSPQKKFVVTDGGNIGLEISPNDASSGTTRILNYNRVAGAYAPYRFEGSVCEFGSGASASVRLEVDVNGNVRAGVSAPATSATDGFLYVPAVAGTPSGAPTAKAGFAPICVDSTNNRLYFYSTGAWRNAGP